MVPDLDHDPELLFLVFTARQQLNAKASKKTFCWGHS